MATENNKPASHLPAEFRRLQFTRELELSFESLTEILKEVLNSEAKNFPHPVGLILGNVYYNAKAVLSLAPDRLVCEAYLVMRVFVDSAVTATYLLFADGAEREAYAAQEIPTAFVKNGGTSGLIQQAKARCDVDRIPVHRMKPIRERIDSIRARTGENLDPWLVAVAALFPHSSELLAGSPDAYESRFKKLESEETAKESGDEFSLLFSMGSYVLYEVVRFCSKQLSIEKFRERAETIHKGATKLMEKRKTGIQDPTQGGWDLLDRLEHFGTHKLSPQLREFEEAFKFSYEAALLVPSLADKNGQHKYAALYFRRALNDLRAVWLLLSQGYTGQAAACAGSLFESSLASICLLREENIRVFEAKQQSATGNDFPWGPMEMTKMRFAPETDLTSFNPTYENKWRSLYARYVWLSQIRHSTLQSVIHEAGASTVNRAGYALVAIPNCLDEDLPVKLGIAVGALTDIQDATSSFLPAAGCEKELGGILFKERHQRATAKTDELIEKFSKMQNPITIARTRFLMRHPPVLIQP